MSGQYVMVFSIVDLATGHAQAEGLIDAPTYANGSPDGGRLVANFSQDLLFDGTRGKFGSYGEGPVTALWAIRTNLVSCPVG